MTITLKASSLQSLPLPRVTYFFGVPAAGKSFLAKFLSEATGTFWYEADSDLPLDVQESIQRKVPFTDEQRDRMYAHIRDRILELLTIHPRLVVSQATFKERHRAMLRAAIPGLKFVWVQAPQAVIVERLNARGGSVDPAYALMIASMFEPPPPGTLTILNDSSIESLEQKLLSLFKIAAKH